MHTHRHVPVKARASSSKWKYSSSVNAPSGLCPLLVSLHSPFPKTSLSVDYFSRSLYLNGIVGQPPFVFLCSWSVVFLGCAHVMCDNNSVILVLSTPQHYWHTMVCILTDLWRLSRWRPGCGYSKYRHTGP